jgi:hypothetical protein
MVMLKDTPVGRPRSGAEPLELVVVKLPRSIADSVRRRANEEDRAVSAYLRRMIVGVVEREDEQTAAVAR